VDKSNQAAPVGSLLASAVDIGKRRLSEQPQTEMTRRPGLSVSGSSGNSGKERLAEAVGSLPVDRQVLMLTWVFDVLDADYGARWNPNQREIVESTEDGKESAADGKESTADGKLTTYARRWVEQLSWCTWADIQRGLRRMKSERPEWPPGAAGFAALCVVTAEELGLPSVDEAYQQACNQDWRFSAVWRAATKVGVGRLRRGSERQTRKAFEREWARVVQAMQHGKTFPGPAVDVARLTREPDVPEGFEEARELLRGGGDPFVVMREAIKHASVSVGS